MAAMTTRSLVTNQRVADDLGVTHSAVSRIRSGQRRPSLELMLKMHEDWEWPLDVQALSWAMGQYPNDFEAELVKKYGE